LLSKIIWGNDKPCHSLLKALRRNLSRFVQRLLMAHKLKGLAASVSYRPVRLAQLIEYGSDEKFL